MPTVLPFSMCQGLLAAQFVIICLPGKCCDFYYLGVTHNGGDFFPSFQGMFSQEWFSQMSAVDAALALDNNLLLCPLGGKCLQFCSLLFMEVIKGHGWTSVGMYTAWQSAVIRGDRDKDAQRDGVNTMITWTKMSWWLIYRWHFAAPLG